MRGSSSLREYKSKRDFKLTPEPKAERKASQKNLIFVVQEHHASHLHYDFRLEWDGVLKSWAVPKGPPRTIGEKRLAVEVEDHPIEYAQFTGEIPAGEYGAGQVYRWDIGKWIPHGDVDKGLKKGHLEFGLDGERLQGEWLLVRTQRQSGKKQQWLLIKRHGGDKATSRTRTSIDFVEPHLAQLVTAPPQGSEWIHELKYDGYRIQALIENGRARLMTRRGLDWSDKNPAIREALTRLPVETAVFDGEVVWQDSQGRGDFQGLQNAIKNRQDDKLIYWIFDLLNLKAED
jgi:bifunctional non-homologous end joining protein LigD